MRSFAFSYCVLVCCAWLLSLGSLLFPEGKWRESVSGREGRWEGAEGNGGRGSWLAYIVSENNLFSIKMYIIYKINFSKI